MLLPYLSTLFNVSSNHVTILCSLLLKNFLLPLAHMIPVPIPNQLPLYSCHSTLTPFHFLCASTHTVVTLFVRFYYSIYYPYHRLEKLDCDWSFLVNRAMLVLQLSYFWVLAQSLHDCQWLLNTWSWGLCTIWFIWVVKKRSLAGGENLKCYVIYAGISSLFIT